LGVEGVTGSTFASTRSAATLSPNSSFPIQGKEKEKVKKKKVGAMRSAATLSPSSSFPNQRKRKKKKEKRGGGRGRLRR